MRLAFLALSGLRICDTALVEAGFSFPALARRARQIEGLPSLGLLTLAGLTPETIEVEYIEIADLDDLGVIVQFDVVALSCLTATAHEAYRIAAHCRGLGITTVLGGLHATLCPEEAQEHVDIVVVGEGEPVWRQILRDIEGERAASRYDARALPTYDLADSPLPRYDLLAPDRYPRFTVQSQRGCPFDCEFCAASIRLGSRFKTKPPELVARDVRALRGLFARPFIELADDNTFADLRHGLKLAEALGAEGVRWFAETDISVAESPDLLKALRGGGCKQLLIGLESPTAPALEGVEQRSNWKARRADRYRQAIETIQSYGIPVNGCFVLGLDGQDRTAFDSVLDFAHSTGLYDVQVTYMTPFPGTPLYRRLSEEGRLLAAASNAHRTLFDLAFQPDRMTVHELREGFHDLVARLYQPDAVLARRRTFRAQWHAGQHLRRQLQ